MSVRVSVVVPTYRRPQLLERCLAALASQEYPADEYEVIIADAAKDPSTRRQVDLWNRGNPISDMGPRFIYLPVPGNNHGPAAARNVGWRAAKGEIIAFTDDDCIPMPTWLTYGTSVFVDGIRGASGRVLLPLPDPPTDYELNAAALSTAQFVTANCFYERSALDAVGGFDERFEMAWREDSDLFFTVMEHNIERNKLVNVQEAVVIHPIRPAKWGVSIEQQKKSLYNALLYKKHPRLFRQFIGPKPPWHYYGMVFSLAGMVIALVMGRKRISLIFTTLWLLLTGEFTLKRLKNTSHTPEHVAEMALTSAIIPFLSIFWRIRGAIRYRTLFF